MKIKVPKNVDEYLKQAYGDIMVDPPESKQISHHFVYSYDISQVRSLYEDSNN